MDAEWQSLLATKDYLFPTRDWRFGTWLANLGTAALAIGLFALRVRQRIGAPGERGIVVASLVLLFGFLVTLPFVASAWALAVQLQISRVFWILDFLAVSALIWWLLDDPGRPTAAWRITVAALLVVVAFARGLWVTFVEHAGAAPITVTLEDDDWGRIIRWAAAQPPTTHLLADPGHAWRYGAPLRFSGRDVVLEEVKDASMAIYARASAARVLARIAALTDFETLDEVRARDLAQRFAVDLLVVDRDLALPEVHREGRFRVYRVR
jgi:hypothetical protein